MIPRHGRLPSEATGAAVSGQSVLWCILHAAGPLNLEPAALSRNRHRCPRVMPPTSTILSRQLMGKPGYLYRRPFTGRCWTLNLMLHSLEPRKKDPADQ
jgi:hypothetical protein